MLTPPLVTSQNEKTTLLGKTKQDYASILRWMSFANSEVLPKLAGWFLPLVGRSPYNKKAGCAGRWEVDIISTTPFLSWCCGKPWRNRLGPATVTPRAVGQRH